MPFLSEYIKRVQNYLTNKITEFMNICVKEIKYGLSCVLTDLDKKTVSSEGENWTEKTESVATATNSYVLCCLRTIYT